MAQQIFGTEVTLFTSAVGGTVPQAAQGAAVPRMQRGSGLVRLHFAVDTNKVTIGDGTFPNAICVLARIDANSTWELLGFAGVGLGAAAPQIPLDPTQNPKRDFSMLVNVADGFQEIAICGKDAAVGVGAGNTLTVKASRVADDGAL